MILAALDERLAWTTREGPSATALLEHVLGAEAAHKLEHRSHAASTRAGSPKGVDAGPSATWSPWEDSCDVLAELRCRFDPILHRDLSRVRVVQDKRGVWVEATFMHDESSSRVVRLDLEAPYPAPDGHPICFKQDSVLTNATRLIACDVDRLRLLGLLRR